MENETFHIPNTTHSIYTTSCRHDATSAMYVCGVGGLAGMYTASLACALLINTHSTQH